MPVNKKTMVAVAKYTVALGIVVFLIYQVLTGEDSENFKQVWTKRDSWNVLYLLLGLVVALAGLSLTFIRWFFLVRALDIEFKLKDSFRLGFIGYFSNFLSLGVVGGDAIKAIFISRERPDKKPEAVSSVLLDRVMGLYALTVVCAIASFAGNQAIGGVGETAAKLQEIAEVSLGISVAGALVGMLLVFVPALTGAAVQNKVERIPRVGRILKKLTYAIYTYRSQPMLLIGLTLMTTLVHCLFAFSVFAIAIGLNVQHPNFVQHLVISPMSNLAASVPLPGGIGGFEWMFSRMYEEGGSSEGEGLAVALGFRLVTILLALIGVLYYLNSKTEIAELEPVVDEA
ncbi:MAG: lysylphosphatidylglycerol synthase transmembrane domain-containing protein [Planctomycetota bacterium]|nr:lysylphosphatidylglycerol synthase transmembrane domain-containing protein [Planctomycetota bacterium]